MCDRVRTQKPLAKPSVPRCNAATPFVSVKICFLFIISVTIVTFIINKESRILAAFEVIGGIRVLYVAAVSRAFLVACPMRLVAGVVGGIVEVAAIASGSAAGSVPSSGAGSGAG
jgi:hypothetical protein